MAGAFGVKGEVRVEISTDNPKKRFRKGKRYVMWRVLWQAMPCHAVQCNCPPPATFQQSAHDTWRANQQYRRKVWEA